MSNPENIKLSEIEFSTASIYDGLLDAKTLVPGEVVYMVTGHNTYKIERREDGYYVSGNEKYCPQPIKVDILSLNQEGIPDTGILWTGQNVRFSGIDTDITFATKSGIQAIYRNMTPFDSDSALEK
jgi:hypothetical protein